MSRFFFFLFSALGQVEARKQQFTTKIDDNKSILVVQSVARTTN